MQRSPDMYYRKNIGDRWFEDSDRLHNWGYLRELRPTMYGITAYKAPPTLAKSH